MAALTCPNCQTVIGEGTTTCPGCGNALGASQATTFSTSAPPPPAGAHAASSPPPPAAGAHAKPQAKFDLAAVGHVERLVGGATLVLFISLFLPWFGFKFALGTVSWDGLTSHGYLWVTLFISLGIIGLIVAEATGLWQWPASAPIAREQVLLIATVINLVLVLLAFLLKPGGYGFSGIGWKWGSFVGLAAAVVAAFPLVWPAIQARRGK